VHQPQRLTGSENKAWKINIQQMKERDVLNLVFSQIDVLNKKEIISWLTQPKMYYKVR
jgi:hypothetical protein